jgi:hypothetical protein
MALKRVKSQDYNPHSVFDLQLRNVASSSEHAKFTPRNTSHAAISIIPLQVVAETGVFVQENTKQRMHVLTRNRTRMPFENTLAIGTSKPSARGQYPSHTFNNSSSSASSNGASGNRGVILHLYGSGRLENPSVKIQQSDES